MKRYLMVLYVAKNGLSEFSSARGYILKDGEPIPSYLKIRDDCLGWANNSGDNFEYFHLSHMQFLDEDDYNSFFKQ